MSLFFIIVGLFYLLKPEIGWKIESWKVKDAKPSDLVLIINRVLGAILLIIGLFKVFVK